MNFKENETTTKLRGGYYTSPEIASFLLKWVAAIRPRRLLEPSCGDGIFFRQMAGVVGLEQSSVLGFEIEPEEAAKARAAASTTPLEADVRNTDFLAWALTNIMAPSVDAVVGNPPFIRYQYLDATLQQRAERLFSCLRLPFTKHTNAWVSFVLGSLSALTPGGRLAMVVPAELLHVLHAQSLRNHLGTQCSRILIFDPEELWFADALQGAVLLLAQKKRTVEEASEGVAIIRTRTSAFLQSDPEDHFARADYANGDTVTGKWMRALLTHRQRELLTAAQQRPSVHRFAQVASADVGIVTGANKFFLVPDETVDRHALHDWAHPMFGRSEHVRGVIYDKAEHARNRKEGYPTNFLWFTAADEGRLTPSARSYLREGETAKLHTRYKCRIRSPWYAVPSVYSTPVGMLKRSHDFPRLIHNSVGAFTTDTAYRINPNEGVTPPSLVYSFVNSLTALSAELEGRHYGGGVLELVPSEIEKLLIPLVPASPQDLRVLDRDVRERADAATLLRLQDQRVLQPLGFSALEREELHDAWMLLRNRRHRISDGDDVGQTTSSTNGEPIDAGA